MQRNNKTTKSMKRSIIIFQFFFLSITLIAQNDYISYYHLCRKAEKLGQAGKIDSASLTFQQAFCNVNYVHDEFLKKAAKIEKKNGNTGKAKEYLELIEMHKNAINVELKREIDSLGKEDQRIRTNKYLKAKYYYYKCLYDSTFKCNQSKFAAARTLMMDWHTTDSLNIEFVKEFIEKNGFPSERLVGNSAYVSAYIMILHYDKDTSNHIMIDALNSALMNGDILPRDYAWIIDRHLDFARKKQRYYTLAFELETLTQVEWDHYNENRASIGLGKLQDLKVVKRGHSISIKYNE